jgi:hypothetical protein
MPTRKFEEEKDSIEIIFLQTKVVCEKRPEYDNFGLFLRPSIIALYKKSSLYFKSIDFLPKINHFVCSQTVIFIENLSVKKVQAIKLAKILT